MKATGKVIEIMPMTTGQGKNGTWRSQDSVIETEGQYAKKICFNLFNDKIDQYPVVLGTEVEVEFDIESQKYNERWFTNIKAWKCSTLGGTQQAAPVATQTAPVAVDEATGLPF